MKRRVLTLVLAVLIAGLGTVGVLAYIRKTDNRAVAGQQTVSVLVAGKAIPSGTAAGTALRDGLLTSEQLPADSVPSDAMRSMTSGLSAKVLSSDVQPGQMLLRPMLIADAQVTGGLAIPAGMVAVTIQLCPPEAVAGNIHAGSHVTVFDTYAAKESATVQSNCNSSEQFNTATQTRIVLPRVLVLSVGSAVGSGQSSSQSSATQSTSATSSTGATGSTLMVTVAVSQADAQRLIEVTQAGLPYLGLLADSSQTKVDTAIAPPGRLPSVKSPPAKP